MDAEFILVYNDSKISKKYCVLAEKWQFFQRVLKMGDFGQNAKGPPFAFWPKSPILSTLWKNCHFSANTQYFLEILLSL